MALTKKILSTLVVFTFLLVAGPSLAIVDDGGGTTPTIPVGECEYSNAGKNVKCNVSVLTGAYPNLAKTSLTSTKAIFKSGSYTQGLYIYTYEITISSGDKDSGSLKQKKIREADGRLFSTTTTVKVSGTPPTFPAASTGTCSDGVKNGDETGVDSGGRCSSGGDGGDGGDSTPAATPSEPVQFGFSEMVDLDNELTSTKGCGADGKYASGILKGVSCSGATKTKEELVQIVKNIIEDFLLPIVGVLFITVLVVGGLVYITSGGNEESLKRAKKILTSGIVGFLIVVLSYTLIRIFVTILGGNIV